MTYREKGTMAITKEELLQKLSDCVLEMEDEDVVDVAQEYIEAGYPAMMDAARLFGRFPLNHELLNSEG